MDELDLRIKMIENELTNQNKILQKLEASMEKQIEIIINQQNCAKRVDALEANNNKIAWVFIMIVFGGITAILAKGWA